MGRNSSHFPGIALESTGASAFQPIRTCHAEYSSRSTNWTNLSLYMGNFHLTSLRLTSLGSHLAGLQNPNLQNNPIATNEYENEFVIDNVIGYL